MMLEFLKPIFTFVALKTLEYVGRNDLITPLVIVVLSIIFFVACGGVITWYLSVRKLKRELASSDAEIISKNLANLEKLHKYRDDTNEKDRLLQIGLGLLIIELGSNDNQRAAAAWDDLKDAFCNDFQPSYVKYVETAEIVYAGFKRKRKAFVDNELFHMLTTSVRFYSTINRPDFVRKLNKAKLPLSKSTLMYAYDYVYSNTSFFDFRIRLKLHILFSDLGIAELSLWGLRIKFK